MILRGRIVGMDMRRTAWPKHQEYWRLVVCPVVGGRQTKERKYVNFHEPKARKINTKEFHLWDAVIIKCNEVKGASGKTFIHGIKIKNASKGRKNPYPNTQEINGTAQVRRGQFGRKTR
jgi:hypothetical protein